MNVPPPFSLAVLKFLFLCSLLWANLLKDVRVGNNYAEVDVHRGCEAALELELPKLDSLQREIGTARICYSFLSIRGNEL